MFFSLFSIFNGDIFNIVFLLFSLFEHELFLPFLLYFLFLLLYFYLVAPYFITKLTDDSRFLLLPFFALASLDYSTRLDWDALWLLNKEREETWWLCLFEILRSFIYICYFWGYLLTLEREFANFDVGFFFLLTLSFFNIQNWLLSYLFLIYILTYNIKYHIHYILYFYLTYIIIPIIFTTPYNLMAVTMDLVGAGIIEAILFIMQTSFYLLLSDPELYQVATDFFVLFPFILFIFLFGHQSKFDIFYDLLIFLFSILSCKLIEKLEFTRLQDEKNLTILAIPIFLYFSEAFVN